MKREDVQRKTVERVLGECIPSKLDNSLRAAVADRIVKAINETFTPAQEHERSFTISVRTNSVRYESGDYMLSSMSADPDSCDALFDALDQTVRKSIAGVR